MTADQIKKYGKYTTAQLRRKAGIKFRKFVRERDKEQACISCGKRTTLQAGHFYSAGHYPGLEFNEDNVHGQCLQCNYHLHGNLVHYREHLQKKIGKERVEILELLVSQSYKGVYKHNRFYLIEIIEKYK